MVSGNTSSATAGAARLPCAAFAPCSLAVNADHGLRRVILPQYFTALAIIGPEHAVEVTGDDGTRYGGHRRGNTGVTEGTLIAAAVRPYMAPEQLATTCVHGVQAGAGQPGIEIVAVAGVVHIIDRRVNAMPLRGHAKVDTALNAAPAYGETPKLAAVFRVVARDMTALVPCD